MEPCNPHGAAATAFTRTHGRAGMPRALPWGLAKGPCHGHGMGYRTGKASERTGGRASDVGMAGDVGLVKALVRVHGACGRGRGGRHGTGRG